MSNTPGAAADRRVENESTSPQGTWSTAAPALDELRKAAATLHRLNTAAAQAQWGETGALADLTADAALEITHFADGSIKDIAAEGASPLWTRRAEDAVRAVAATSGTAPTPHQATADAMLAASLANIAVAEATLAAARAAGIPTHTPDRPAMSRIAALRFTDSLAGLGRNVIAEVRHILAGQPRSILVRIAITLALSAALVVSYHTLGWRRYDDAASMTLYVFSVIVGSVVCTNALCFEASRVRRRLAGGQRLWQLLIVKNLAMAVLVMAAGTPVIAVLALTAGTNPIAMIDQFITMIFIWLGVGNVLSVIFPLRQEPFSARLRDGTWVPYLLSFALSYGVGLTVNLMIYWRLWARHSAGDHITGGDTAAFVVVVVSALSSWILLTLLAVACSHNPRIRQLLSQEMVEYQAQRTRA